jgi:replicative DNA helicase
VLSDEAAIFTQMAGQYGDKANLDVYLKAHDGGELQVNRRERDETITRATMTIGVAVQPAVLEQLGGNSQLRGRGLTARFLYSLPPSLVGWREIETPLMPEEVKTRYDEHVAAIAAALLPDPGGKPMGLQVDPGALAVLNDFRAQIEPRLRPDEDLANLGGWIAKLAGHTARIAALLHLMHLPPEQWTTVDVSGATMRGAVQLAWYFVGHALAAFDVMGADDTFRTAQRVLDWAARKGRTRFSHRDAFDALRNSDLRKTTGLDAPLALLVNFGWLSPLPPPPSGAQGGRRPSPEYAVHPSVVNGAALR